MRSTSSESQQPESSPSNRVESSDLVCVEKGQAIRVAVSCDQLQCLALYCCFFVDDHENTKGATYQRDFVCFIICCFATNTNLRLTDNLVMDDTRPSRLLLRFSYATRSALHISINVSETSESPGRQRFSLGSEADKHCHRYTNATALREMMAAEKRAVKAERTFDESQDRSIVCGEIDACCSDFRRHHYCLSILLPPTSTATSLRYGGRFVSVVSCDRADIHEHD